MSLKSQLKKREFEIITNTIIKLLSDKQFTFVRLARELEIGERTAYRLIREHGISLSDFQ